MDEFEFIDTYLRPLTGAQGLGLMDDAAEFTPSPGHDLVLSQDALVEGVHVPRGVRGGELAQKLLRVNLSDLAAKGALPRGYLLSIVWPRGVEPEIYAQFAAGLADVQKQYDFDLWGGDTVVSDGPMVVSVTIIGELPCGEMIKRSGARPGDDIWLSGSLGAAYLGLLIETDAPLSPPPTHQNAKDWVNAYYRPTPRLDLAQRLRPYASASIDISDGLIADAAHVARASGVGMDLKIDDIQPSPSLTRWFEAQPDQAKARDTLITAGDDYELLFCAPPKHRTAIEALGRSICCPLRQIGTVTAQAPKVRCWDREGQEVRFARSGYKHF